ncbi:MAG: hypothetical protein KAX30_07695 [Candidatus Atribacteria bacterium]|nr:hypothetical protein [Candidatus Atribacteria bacterium]
MIINRFFSSKNLKRMKDDFKFLLEMIEYKDYGGELDLALRDNYFNLYYKGNSLARVEFNKGDSYKIKINEKFFSDTGADKDKRFSNKEEKDKHFEIILDNKLLHPFFQKKYINQFISNIREVNNGEEITLEQAIITDNLEREDIIIIDRQIKDKVFKKRMDLLALYQVEKNKNEYNFWVIEVKLGNNPELKDKVAIQLDGYVSHIGKNFDDYKDCYEKQYEQKKELNLISIPKCKSIKIVRPVKGLIAVVGYSGLAKDQIAQLKSNHSRLKIESLDYSLKNVFKNS